MAVPYHHASNVHTEAGPRAALRVLFADGTPRSLLDVGCGTGTWLRAALDAGVPEILGIDGVDVSERQLLIPRKAFVQQDLTQPWDLGRQFDAVLCLEVAEHLDEVYADVLIASITRHSSVVYFSAAAPGQPGEHHANCQWPAYWQDRFNANGFVCADDVRWDIWDQRVIEPWYRQNMFVARRDPEAAGKETRIKSVAHPDLLQFVRDRLRPTSWPEYLELLEKGEMKVSWYVTTPFKAGFSKIARRIYGERRSGRRSDTGPLV